MKLNLTSQKELMEKRLNKPSPILLYRWDWLKKKNAQSVMIISLDVSKSIITTKIAKSVVIL